MKLWYWLTDSPAQARARRGETGGSVPKVEEIEYTCGKHASPLTAEELAELDALDNVDDVDDDEADAPTYVRRTGKKTETRKPSTKPTQCPIYQLDGDTVDVGAIEDADDGEVTIISRDTRHGKPHTERMSARDAREALGLDDCDE